MPASTDLDKGAAPDLQQEIKQLVRVEADMLTRVGVMAREAKDREGR